MNPTLPLPMAAWRALRMAAHACTRRAGWLATAGRVLWSALVLSLGLAAQTAWAQACPPPLSTQISNTPPADRGLLWRISRDGHSSWLFGTVHVGKPDWRRFGPRLRAALKDSDVLALEIDPNDPQLAAELIEPGPTLTLPPELQSRLTRAFEAACISPTLLAPLHPLLQVTTLTVLEARWLGLDPQYAMEQLLISQARSQGRPVVALETAAQQKAALIPESTGGPGEMLASISQGLAQLEDRSGRRVMTRLVQAWEAGDLDTLEQYERWCECVQTAEDRRALARLNDGRNAALASGIAAQHQAGKRVFAAVGALHMTGPQALPLLLARQGFQVERVSLRR